MGQDLTVVDVEVVFLTNHVGGLDEVTAQESLVDLLEDLLPAFEVPWVSWNPLQFLVVVLQRVELAELLDILVLVFNPSQILEVVPLLRAPILDKSLVGML